MSIISGPASFRTAETDVVAWSRAAWYSGARAGVVSVSVVAVDDNGDHDDENLLLALAIEACGAKDCTDDAAQKRERIAN